MSGIDRSHFSAIILAGGASSRMGREKCSILLGNKSLLDRTIDLLGMFSDEILISSNTLVSPYNNIPVYPDEEKGLGPLGGLNSTLKKISREAAFILPCDTPLIPSEIIAYLLKAYEGRPTVLSVNDRMQPLCGIYPADMSRLIANSVEAGHLKLQSLIEEAGGKVCRLENSGIKTDHRRFLNINTPEKLDAALALLNNS